MRTNWTPCTAEERIAAELLHAALVRLNTVSAFEPAAGLNALDNLGRTCVQILGNTPVTTDGISTVHALVKTLTPVTAPIVARWAGIDAEDSEKLTGLREDLNDIRERTTAVQQQLQRILT